MADKLCLGPCGQTKPLEQFHKRPQSADGRTARCKLCNCAAEKRRYADRREPVVDEAMLAFGTPIERESGAALLAHGSVVDAAAALQLEPGQLRAHLHELQRRAATRGYAPGSDMTKTTPDGYRVKGVSSYYDGEGKLKGQWVKTKRDEDERYAALLDAMAGIGAAWRGVADPVPQRKAQKYDPNTMSVVPMGDPHLGMYAWAEETGAHFDVEIAERNLVGAVDKLIDLAPPSQRGLLISLGDFFHADSSAGTTTAGTRVDVDTRWSKVLRAGIRTMRRCIDRMLLKHETVDVISEIGNHDAHTSIMLAICLAQFYEREPRVVVDISPAKFHWRRFGKCLIGTTHSDTTKPADLPGVMACDRAQDWGETLYRHMYCGHVHHDSVKEFPGCTVETMRTLAPKDAWHAGKGYRSGQDMKLDVWDARYGHIMRHIVGIDQLQPGE